MKPKVLAKKLSVAILTFTAAVCSDSAAEARGTMNVLDVTYNVDTLAHFKVGPGTTTTYIRLTSPVASQLQVHYLTIDKSTPGVSIRAVCGTDKVAGTERVSSMAKRKSVGNTLYFAGANADFFTTSGNATNGTSKVGSPTTSCTVDGEIYKTSNSQYQFSIDDEGIARIGRLNYYTGTAKIQDKVTLFKGVNVAAPNNGITIYTSKYWGSSNQTDYVGTDYEVTAKLVEGDSFVAGRSFRLEVTSEPTDQTDTTIPAGGYVIHGRGTSKTGCNTGAKDFVAALKPGDIVEFDNIVLFGDQRIYPTQIVSGNPKNVGEGKTLDTESERGDASAYHPRTGIGVSEDGNTIIMMVVEGRHGGSAGVRTSQLADIMRYAGAYEAVNLDGGGSSTLYTSAFGVRNYCSDGNERAVGNGIFAVVESPADDKEITEIRFADWTTRLPVHGHYTPVIHGFNRYGVLVDDNVRDYMLEVAPDEGEIVDEGKALYASAPGMHALHATYNGISASMAFTVDNDCKFNARLSSLLIDDVREYPIELSADNGVTLIPVKASTLSWSSADAAVATVSEDGVIKGIADGRTTVTGTIGDQVITINVTVEIPKSPKSNIVENFNSDEWKFTSAGCAAAETGIAPKESGYQINYKVSSTRSMSLTVASATEIPFWSLPERLECEVLSSKPLKNILVKFKDALGTAYSLTTPAVAAEDRYVYTVNLAEQMDINDIAVYPITFTSLTFYPSSIKTGDTGTVEVPYINAVYRDGAGVEEVVITENDFDGEPEYFNIQGIRIPRPAPGLYIERKGSKAVKKILR